MEDYAFCVNGDKGASYSLYAEPGFGRIGAEKRESRHIHLGRNVCKSRMWYISVLIFALCFFRYSVCCYK